ncbi:hypothetical protein TGP89_422240, partial [Toxoplasma gondii p89]
MHQRHRKTGTHCLQKAFPLKSTRSRLCCSWRLPGSLLSTCTRVEFETLSLSLHRSGENILTLTAEAPPPAKPKTVSGPVAPNAIPGRGVPAGRGAALAPVAPVAPVGLAGPVRGVGG